MPHQHRTSPRVQMPSSLMEPVRLHAEREVDFSPEPPTTEEVENLQEFTSSDHCLAQPEGNSAAELKHPDGEGQSDSSAELPVWGAAEDGQRGDHPVASSSGVAQSSAGLQARERTAACGTEPPSRATQSSVLSEERTDDDYDDYDDYDDDCDGDDDSDSDCSDGEAEAWHPGPGHFGDEGSDGQSARRQAQACTETLRWLTRDLLDHLARGPQVHLDGEEEEEEEDSETDPESSFAEEDALDAEQAQRYEGHVQRLALLFSALLYPTLPQHSSG